MSQIQPAEAPSRRPRPNALEPALRGAAWDKIKAFLEQRADYHLAKLVKGDNDRRKEDKARYAHAEIMHIINELEGDEATPQPPALP